MGIGFVTSASHERHLQSNPKAKNLQSYLTMKPFTKFTLFAAGLAVAALPLINAADTEAAAPAPAGKHALAGKHPRLRALGRSKAVRQRIAQKLNLSTDQIAQLKASRASTVASVKAIRADSSLTPDQKKAKVRETVQAARASLKGVLNADQQAKMRKLRGFLRNRAQARRGV